MPRKWRRLAENGPTEQLLLGLLLEPGSIRTMHPWLARAAKAALRRGLVEVVVGHDDLIAITGNGRQALGLPEGALTRRDPIEILDAAQVVVYGHIRYRLLGPMSTGEGAILIAKIAGVEHPHEAFVWYVALVAKIATEQGLPCAPLYDRGRLVGFVRA